ncbi:MAG: transporter [Nocardioidaceae bacterium]|nr:transporter [Nocardioidaceae bacterium]
MIQRARIATCVFFVLNGFTLGTWVVHIPVIQDRADISKETLGYLILILGGAALVGMYVTGRLIDHFGSSKVVYVGSLLVSLSLLGPGLATSGFGLGIALTLLGLSNGLVDVSENAQGVEVEREYGRPILSAFHAFFSLGGILAAIVGGVAISLGVDIRLTLGIAAAIGIVVATSVRPWLFVAPPLVHATSGPRTKATWTSRVLLLGGLAFAILLAEGVAYDWSTVHLHDSLGASKAVAAYAFGIFSAMMTIVRLCADRIVARIGSAQYVRVAATIGAVGLSTAALSQTVPVALLGWGIFGVGLAGCVPQFFSAAGNVDPSASGSYLARVTACGYLGLLAGPAIIGILTRWVPLTTAFLVPLAGCVAAALLAPRALRQDVVHAPASD